jgi:membrane protein YqaA with SNARE-associated domain
MTMDWALFASAFLSATLLPGSSEALLLLRLAEGHPWLPLVLVATAGNLMGSLLTYGMGRVGNRVLHNRWLGIDEHEVSRAEAWFRKWGLSSLLLAWLPVVGDPLCLVAGLLRVRFIPFVFLVGTGKLARYGFLAWFVI